MKRTIRLSEGRLRRMIREAVDDYMQDDEQQIDDPVVSELAEIVGCDPEDIEEENYNPYDGCTAYDCAGQRWYVFDNDDYLHEAAIQTNMDLIEEGCMPNMDYLGGSIDVYLNPSDIDMIVQGWEDYRYDEGEEELEFGDVYNSVGDYLKEIYGNDVFKYCKDMINVRALAEACVDVDGDAHLIASYDGNTYDLDGGRIAMRID